MRKQKETSEAPGGSGLCVIRFGGLTFFKDSSGGTPALPVVGGLNSDRLRLKLCAEGILNQVDALAEGE